jgi:cytochrome P450
VPGIDALNPLPGQATDIADRTWRHPMTSTRTTTPATASGDLFARVLDPANRPDPYPLYAQLREHPVAVQDDGSFVVSTYTEIDQLLHDPRISSDERKSARGAGALIASGRLAPQGEPRRGSPAGGAPQSVDPLPRPPDHDRLRRLVVHQFTPARINGMHRRIEELDVVDDLAYPLPVTVICELLGVPREDEPRFHGWASAVARGLDPAESLTDAEIRQAEQASLQLNEYLTGLVEGRRAHPGDDLLSGLVAGPTPDGWMTEADLLSTMRLLLVAGHETTVNLITNGMLTMLRPPDVLDRLRADPELVVPLVEEVLRYDPPVQFRTRTTLADLPVAGTTIPQGATVVLLLASGSRDPHRFPRPDEFIPDRADNTHLGFGGGLHYCVGAPLARIEAQIALTALSRHLVAPRLLADLACLPTGTPPPYAAPAPASRLRGPAGLTVSMAGPACTAKLGRTRPARRRTVAASVKPLREER